MPVHHTIKAANDATVTDVSVSPSAAFSMIIGDSRNISPANVAVPGAAYDRANR